MGKGEGLLRQLADRMELTGEPLPGQPVAELWGNQRVLIEPHRGIVAYSREQITVKVKFGLLEIDGEDLELTRMTADTLIISGKIRSIAGRELPCASGNP